MNSLVSFTFRMAYFERRGAVLTWSQLQSEVTRHYTSQAIQQAYVLLLGLDVLGNPYGLVRDFTQGLGDFFYEPFLVCSEHSVTILKRFNVILCNAMLNNVVSSFIGRLDSS